MKTNDLIRFALLFLGRRKTMTFLTILGVIIGTVCIVLMLSIGMTNYEALREMIDGRSSLTEIRISSGRADITQSDIEDMRSVPHVAAISPLLQLPGRLSCGSYEAWSTLVGIEADVLHLTFAEGGMFPPSESRPILVVGGDTVRDFVDPDRPPDYSDWEAYEAYSPDIDWLAAEFMFRFGYSEEAANGEDPPPETQGILMHVSGVTKPGNSMTTGSIYLDLAAARQILKQNAPLAEALGISLSTYSEALIRADDMENVAEVLEAVRALGFEAYSDVEFINEMRSEQSRQFLQLLVIGLVSLVVSAIGIANTMYAGILERRRDIGILKVLGMKRRRLQRLFLIEAAIIGLLGGIIGLGVSWVILTVLNASMASGNLLGMYFEEGTKISVPLPIAAGAILTACLTGVLAGQWPAAKAARMSPLDAMRPDR